MAGTVLSMSILEPEVQIKGGIFIVDLSDIPLNFAWYMTPKLASDMVNMAGVSINRKHTSIFLRKNILYIF